MLLGNSKSKRAVVLYLKLFRMVYSFFLLTFKLSGRTPDDTLRLHTIPFGRRGKAVQVKSNISRFSGFVWLENEEKQKTKVKENCWSFVTCSTYQVQGLLRGRNTTVVSNLILLLGLCFNRRLRVEHL